MSRTKVSNPYLDSHINKIISFIGKNQKFLGNWNIQESTINEDGELDIKNIQEREITFTTSLILLCLSKAKESAETRKMIRKGVGFLHNERSSKWTWNYRLRDSNEKKIPDDLDDTSCALAAIFHHDPKSITEETLVSIVKTLTATEIKLGGPYNTWIVPDIHSKPWNDVDVVVNSNIAYFLSLQDIEIPSLNKLAEEVIDNKLYKTRYYTSPISILYFISRFYKGGHIHKAIKRLIKESNIFTKTDSPSKNTLLLSMLITSLLNFHAHIKNQNQFDSTWVLIRNLIAILKKQTKTCIFKAYGCYIEESHNNTTYAGSSALTAAFVAETLLTFKEAEHLFKDQTLRRSHIKKQEELKKKIISSVRYTFKDCSEFSKSVVSKTLDKILLHDHLSQVTLLPYLAHTSLITRIKTKINTQTLINLGIANTLGWLAYTLYDDILDEDSDPVLLTIANTALREVVYIYSSIIPAKQFYIFKEIMNDIEEANSWERRSCRILKGQFDTKLIPDYTDLSVLANKSMGHALPLLTMFIIAGHSANSKTISLLRIFFKHYIIAKQLNDDAHDWQEDLEKGFINSVSSHIISNYSGTSSILHIKEIKTNLQKIFWNQTIDTVSESIFLHVKKAKRAIHSLKEIEDPTYLLSLLIPIENAAKKALTERDKTKKFLTLYE